MKDTRVYRSAEIGKGLVQSEPVKVGKRRLCLRPLKLHYAQVDGYQTQEDERPEVVEDEEVQDEFQVLNKAHTQVSELTLVYLGKKSNRRTANSCGTPYIKRKDIKGRP